MASSPIINNLKKPHNQYNKYIPNLETKTMCAAIWLLN